MNTLAFKENLVAYVQYPPPPTLLRFLRYTNPSGTQINSITPYCSFLATSSDSNNDRLLTLIRIVTIITPPVELE